jgi:hypothetical protein
VRHRTRYRKVSSLGRLLDQIAKAPDVVSRSRYVDLLSPMDHKQGNEFFDALTSPGARTIDPAVPLAQLERIREETRTIRNWIDTSVAHLDQRTWTFELDTSFTFVDLDRAIDSLFTTMNRYTQLLLGRAVVGSVSMPPWEAVFRVPWIPDDDAWRNLRETIDSRDRVRLTSLT